MHVKDIVQNMNNNINATCSQKELHLWCNKTGNRIKSFKVIQIGG